MAIDCNKITLSERAMKRKHTARSWSLYDKLATVLELNNQHERQPIERQDKKGIAYQGIDTVVECSVGCSLVFSAERLSLCHGGIWKALGTFDLTTRFYRSIRDFVDFDAKI